MSGLAGLLRKNIVLVVCIPSIVAIHWGWYRLQYNPKFVSQEPCRMYKTFWFGLDATSWCRFLLSLLPYMLVRGH
ncbi:hypothetical protein LSAT2_018877 [Lamellibrachia satsuma]|nr:hypothetical protein LSAT2_018877 [Lamellibrachia satsuma]